MKFHAKHLLACALVFSQMASAWGAMVIEGTRVVVRGADRETVVRMNNQGTTPLVVQSWIDNGEAERNKSPDQIQVPFVLTPPISRVDPSKGQTVRIYPAAGTLPQDRESVFWFNVLEIPPKTKNTEENLVQFTIRSRLKLFYRPQALGRDVPREAIAQVKWSLATDKDGRQVLRAHNPTPYYFTFGQGEAHQAVRRDGRPERHGRSASRQRGRPDGGQKLQAQLHQRLWRRGGFRGPAALICGTRLVHASKRAVTFAPVRPQPGAGQRRAGPRQ
jgi:chaperone protein EcpD